MSVRSRNPSAVSDEPRFDVVLRVGHEMQISTRRPKRTRTWHSRQGIYDIISIIVEMLRKELPIIISEEEKAEHDNIRYKYSMATKELEDLIEQLDDAIKLPLSTNEYQWVIDRLSSTSREVVEEVHLRRERDRREGILRD